MGREEFQIAFEKASLATLSRREHLVYEDSLKAYRDLNNVIDTSYGDGLAEGLEKGREEGRTEGLEEALKKLIASGMSESEARLILKL